MFFVSFGFVFATDSFNPDYNLLTLVYFVELKEKLFCVKIIMLPKACSV